MDQETIDLILKEHKPIIQQSIKEHKEFIYINACRRKLKLPSRYEKAYIDNSLDQYLEYIRLKNNPWESRYWALEDITIEMYEDLGRQNALRNAYGKL